MPDNQFIKFGIDLLPNSNLGFNLGSSSLKWNIYGTLTGNSSTATSWAAAQKIKVILGTQYGTGTNQSETTINGGQTSVQTVAVDGVLGTPNGGTGLSSYTQYDILYASATNTLAKLNKGTTAGAPLITGASSAAPSWYNGLILTGTASNDYNASFSGTVNITGATGIGANADSSFKLYVNGDSKFNGNLIPTLSTDATSVPDKTLGSSTNRWANVYIGTADTYGDAYTPIYWNDGVPAEVTVVKKYTFSFNNSSATTAIVTPSNSNASACIVTEIVVDTGIQYLNGEISWDVPTTGDNANKIVLTTLATSGTVSGYILVSTGT